jgi:hypothetical protein
MLKKCTIHSILNVYIHLIGILGGYINELAVMV